MSAKNLGKTVISPRVCALSWSLWQSEVSKPVGGHSGRRWTSWKGLQKAWRRKPCLGVSPWIWTSLTGSWRSSCTNAGRSLHPPLNLCALHWLFSLLPQHPHLTLSVQPVLNDFFKCATKCSLSFCPHCCVGCEMCPPGSYV